MQMDTFNDNYATIFVSVYLDGIDLRTDLKGNFNEGIPDTVEYGGIIEAMCNICVGCQIVKERIKIEVSCPEGIEVIHQDVRISSDSNKSSINIKLKFAHRYGYGIYLIKGRVIHKEMGIELLTLEPYTGIKFKVPQPELIINEVTFISDTYDTIHVQEYGTVPVFSTPDNIEVQIRYTYPSKEKTVFHVLPLILPLGLDPSFTSHSKDMIVSDAKEKKISLKYDKIIPVKHIINMGNQKPGFYQLYVRYRSEIFREPKTIDTDTIFFINKGASAVLDNIAMYINDTVEVNNVMEGDVIKIQGKIFFLKEGDYKIYALVTSNNRVITKALLQNIGKVTQGIHDFTGEFTFKISSEEYKDTVFGIYAAIAHGDKVPETLDDTVACCLVKEVNYTGIGELSVPVVYTPDFVLARDTEDLKLRVAIDNRGSRVKGTLKLRIGSARGRVDSVHKLPVVLERGMNSFDLSIPIDNFTLDNILDVITAHCTLEVEGHNTVYKSTVLPLCVIEPDVELHINNGIYPKTGGYRRVLKRYDSPEVAKRIINVLDIDEGISSMLKLGHFYVVFTNKNTAIITHQKTDRFGFKDIFASAIRFNTNVVSKVYGTVANTFKPKTNGSIPKTPIVSELYQYIKIRKIRHNWKIYRFIQDIEHFLGLISDTNTYEPRNVIDTADRIIRGIEYIIREVKGLDINDNNEVIIETLRYLSEYITRTSVAIATPRRLLNITIAHTAFIILCYLGCKNAYETLELMDTNISTRRMLSEAMDRLIKDWTYVLYTIVLLWSIYSNHNTNMSYREGLRNCRKKGILSINVENTDSNMRSEDTIAIHIDQFTFQVPVITTSVSQGDIEPALVFGDTQWHIIGHGTTTFGKMYRLKPNAKYLVIPPLRTLHGIYHAYMYPIPIRKMLIEIYDNVYNVAKTLANISHDLKNIKDTFTFKPDKMCSTLANKPYNHYKLQDMGHIIRAHITGHHNILSSGLKKRYLRVINKDGDLLITKLAMELDMSAEDVTSMLLKKGVFDLRMTTESMGFIFKRKYTDYILSLATVNQVFRRILSGKVNIEPNDPILNDDLISFIYYALCINLTGNMYRFFIFPSDIIRSILRLKQSKGAKKVQNTSASDLTYNIIKRRYLSNVSKPEYGQLTKFSKFIRKEMNRKIKSPLRLGVWPLNRAIDVCLAIYLTDHNELKEFLWDKNNLEIMRESDLRILYNLLNTARAMMLVDGVGAYECRRTVIERIAVILRLGDVYKEFAEDVVARIESTKGHRGIRIAQALGSAGDVNILPELQSHYYSCSIEVRKNLETAIKNFVEYT